MRGTIRLDLAQGLGLVPHHPSRPLLADYAAAIETFHRRCSFRSPGPPPVPGRISIT